MLILDFGIWIADLRYERLIVHLTSLILNPKSEF
jgi:hypothetical protein